jgi:hypothetical protein
MVLMASKEEITTHLDCLMIGPVGLGLPATRLTPTGEGHNPHSQGDHEASQQPWGYAGVVEGSQEEPEPSSE